MDFTATRARFQLPEGLVYLDGNSLGPLTQGVAERLNACVADQWGRQLIGAWNQSDWIGQPRRVGDRIGRLIGAEPGAVTMGDTLSVKVYQALAAALALRPDRNVILSDDGNFPTDLYMAQGLAALRGRGELKIVPPEAVADAIDETVAVLMLTEVDYRTGAKHDMAALTAKANAAGALTLWDLAHSAGALPVDLAGAGADFAAGCTYKYLNGGPGAPAFIYIAPRHAEQAQAFLSGWMGHAQPFAFDLDYRPADGAARMRIGTPPVLALSALEAALDVWDEADMNAVRARSLALSERLIAGVETACPDLILASPREGARRGSQVSFRHPEGYAIMQALIARDVVGDFRAPDIIRFGIAPLYVTQADIDRAIATLADVMTQALWDDPAYRTRAAVT